ncbi:hypothetical protein MPH_08437, partial [Macrophomina phaseolina MS6]
ALYYYLSLLFLLII